MGTLTDFGQIALKWDPKNLEIRTMSVEKTLEPLVLQVTTLVNTKGPSKKKKGALQDLSLGTAITAIYHNNKRATSVSFDRRLVRKSNKNPFLSSKHLKNDLNAPVTSRTIRNRLIEADLKAHSHRKVPYLSKKKYRQTCTFREGVFIAFQLEKYVVIGRNQDEFVWI
uniref:Uncharacterized protein LOC108038178 n=1 Tax=Drosophila rhopaloa TaxID=1041015 RepID=A0A6P4E205_DRORH